MFTHRWLNESADTFTHELEAAEARGWHSYGKMIAHVLSPILRCVKIVRRSEAGTLQTLSSTLKVSNAPSADLPKDVHLDTRAYKTL